MQGWFWACPECCGDFFEPPEPAHTRCIGCGKTLNQWARQFPREVTVQGLLYPDTCYERSVIDDPTWPPPIDPS